MSIWLASQILTSWIERAWKEMSLEWVEQGSIRTSRCSEWEDDSGSLPCGPSNSEGCP
jgi:hypothetical protein